MEFFVGLILVLTALIGSGIAGIVDLKTTEVPDKLVVLMCIIGIATRIAYSFLTGDWNFSLIPFGVALGFLEFGIVMYYLGQWGLGDTELLVAVTLLIGVLPEGFYQSSQFPIYFNYFTNIFLIGAGYIIFYAFYASFKNKKIEKRFFKELKKSKNEFLIFSTITITIVILLNAIFWFVTRNLILSTLFLIPLPPSLYLLFKFLKAVEEVAFRKRINVKDLKPGDMLGEDVPELGLKCKLIRGLKEHEIEKIKKIKTKVWIREGVRFAPVFFIAAIVTLLYGNLLFLII